MPDDDDAKCFYCGDSVDDVAFLERCDICNRLYCDDCAPYRDDDAPIDVCLPCCEKRNAEPVR